MTAFTTEFIIGKVFSAALGTDQKEFGTALPAEFSCCGIFSFAFRTIHCTLRVELKADSSKQNITEKAIIK
jgi:hypothetical protein